MQAETVSGAIREAARRLADTSDTARLDAELLMAHALGVSRSELLVRHMRDDAPPPFGLLIERRAAHEPVAYITGHAGFYGRDFAVTPDVLIPRPDSETLIDVALELAPQPQRILDLGTGSGALLLTLLAELPEALGVGIDASPRAVEVAKRNAQALALEARAKIEVCDWNAAGWTDSLGTFDLIICNPPYVETGAALDPQVRGHEPHAALFAGDTGLDEYRAIIPQLGPLLQPQALALFEIGPSQGDAVSEIARTAGFACEIRCDLANRPRCAVLSR